MADSHEGTSELAGKYALVTGGSEGIGAAIVRRLAIAGATVATAARRAPSSIEEGDAARRWAPTNDAPAAKPAATPSCRRPSA